MLVGELYVTGGNIFIQQTKHKSLLCLF